MRKNLKILLRIWCKYTSTTDDNEYKMLCVVRWISNFNDYIAKNLEYKAKYGRHDPSLCENNLLVANYIKTTPLRDVVDDSCFEMSKLSVRDRDTTILVFFQKKNRGDIKPKLLLKSVKRFLCEFDSCGDGVLRYRNSWPWTTAEKMYNFLNRVCKGQKVQTKMNHQRVITDNIVEDVIRSIVLHMMYNKIFDINKAHMECMKNS